MVVCTHVLGYAAKATREFLRKAFIDSLHIHAKGGNGGSGNPRYGGIGGRGGNVEIVATKGASLKKLKYKLAKIKAHASTGRDSTGVGLIGEPGQDLSFEVPVGITVISQDGITLGEVNKEGEKLVIAKGGIGGCKETQFCGLKGQAHAVTLDLKLIADVGLVGFPNAGKSTFLKAMSQAKPRIASYPFTTIRPQLGIIQYPDYRQISVADLPGLIEGAHANIGMGHKFLKHLDRTKLLLFIVDIQGFQLSVKHAYRSCLETIILLNKEIELYKPDLLNMPAMLLINKMDTDNADKIFKEIQGNLDDLSKCIAQFPTDIHPNKLVHFQHIAKTSLLQQKEKDIDTIKTVIRSILDKYEEQQRIHESECLEEELYSDLKQKGKQYIPTLV